MPVLATLIAILCMSLYPVASRAQPLADDDAGQMRFGRSPGRAMNVGKSQDCMLVAYCANATSGRNPGRSPSVGRSASRRAGSETPDGALGARKASISKLVRTLAPDYGLHPELVLAVVEAESNYDPNARSDKNALGLMQLIPETAARFRVVNVWNPEQNLRGGMAYLRWLMREFDGDIALALAGYNAGEGAVRRHGGIPPYPETRSYVERITARLRR